MFFEKSVKFPALLSFLHDIDRAPFSVKLQFLLDPLAFPAIFEFWKLFGPELINHIYYLIRTYAYYLYKKKQVLIGNWPGEKLRLLCKKSAKGKKEQIKSVVFSGEFRDSSTGRSQQLDTRVAIPYLTLQYTCGLTAGV